MAKFLLHITRQALCKLIVLTLLNKFDFFLVIEGNTGCLTGDTIIRYSRGHNARKVSIKKLFEWYHGTKNDKKLDLSIPTYIRSWNGKEIRLHKLKDVFYSGKQKVYKLILEDGKTIKATSDHKFLTASNDWKELKDLNVGDVIFCDTPKATKNGRKKIKLRDISLKVDYHPYKNILHKEVEVHRLIYEARLNNLDFLEYLDILLNEPEKAKNLEFINPDVHVIHHKDGCHYNNSIENLQLMLKNNHMKLHGENSYANFSQGIPKPIKVKEIIEGGIEDVYDIECEKPYHNFVANDILVHNCGKSTLGIHIARGVKAEFRRLYRLEEDTVRYYYDRVIKKQMVSEDEFCQFLLELKEKKAYDYNPNNDLIYDQKSMMRSLISWNKIFISDEMVGITFNRDFQTDNQKKIIKLINMSRDHCNLIIACVPQFQTLDVQIKNLTKMRISVAKRGAGVVQTPNRIIYGRDRWDSTLNEKIEREWLILGKKPKYTKLTTTRGLIAFPPLTKRIEDEYHKIKNFKRTFIVEKDMGIVQEQVKKEPIQEIYEELIAGKIRNNTQLEGFALAHKLDPEGVRGKLRRMLIKNCKGSQLQQFYWEKKTRNKNIDENALDSITR
jgi:hypothetical protein